jgi:hypothetical protein
MCRCGYAYNLSIHINHDGGFIAGDSNPSYVDDKHVWYDYVHVETMYVAKLEELVEDLGNDMVGRTNSFYDVLEKRIHEGGHMQIRSER